MAHFAELNENNIVINIIKVNNEDCLDLFGQDKIYIQTSINDNIRRDYAAIGGRYDPNLDVFIGIQPFPSWSLDEQGYWQPPIPWHPDDGQIYNWDEENLQWVLMTEQV